MAETLGSIVAVIAIVGVVLNNRRNRACFVLWLGSNALSAGIHLSAGMLALTLRDVAFFALAVHGLLCWSRATGGK